MSESKEDFKLTIFDNYLDEMPVKSLRFIGDIIVEPTIELIKENIEFFFLIFEDPKSISQIMQKLKIHSSPLFEALEKGFFNHNDYFWRDVASFRSAIKKLKSDDCEMQQYLKSNPIMNKALSHVNYEQDLIILVLKGKFKKTEEPAVKMIKEPAVLDATTFLTIIENYISSITNFIGVIEDLSAYSKHVLSC